MNDKRHPIVIGQPYKISKLQRDFQTSLQPPCKSIRSPYWSLSPPQTMGIRITYLHYTLVLGQIGSRRMPGATERLFMGLLIVQKVLLTCILDFASYCYCFVVWVPYLLYISYLTNTLLTTTVMFFRIKYRFYKLLNFYYYNMHIILFFKYFACV